MSDNDKSGNFNRREILKQLGTAGTVAALGMSGTSAATSGTPADKSQFETKNGIVVSKKGQDFEITGHSVIKGSRARHLLQGANSNASIKNIQSYLKENGLRSYNKGSTGLEFTTNNEEINAMDPALVTLPFVEKGNPSDATNVGMLVTVVADVDNSRVPVATVGLLTKKSGDKYYREVIGSNDGKATLLAEHTVGEEFTTSQSLSCATCSIVYNGLCDTAYYVSAEIACIGLCVPTGEAYPICEAGCQLIAAGISAYGCYYSGNYFCKNLINIC